MISILEDLTGFEKDTIVKSLPFILMEIRNYTKQYFLTKTNSNIVKIENGKIYLDNVSGFKPGDTIELLNSENNTLIYQIKTVADDYITVEQPIVDELNTSQMKVIKLSFKNVNLKTISDMLKYSVNFSDLSGIKRQGLGGSYTVEYFTADGGKTLFPIELYGGINSLRKLDDNYAEYWRKGYVRL